MQREMRLLWVTDETPDRGKGGGSIRQAHLFEALAAAYAVDLLVVGEVGDDRVRSMAANLVTLPKLSGRWTEHPIGRRLLELAILIGSPYPSYAYPARPARRALARALQKQTTTYDVVCLEHAALAPLRSRVRGRKTIITLHHLYSGMARQELEIAPGGRQRWYRAQDLRKAERLERRVLRTFDSVVVCSDEDAAAVGGPRSIDRRRVTVIPNGVDLHQFHPSPLPDRPQILLPATLDYAPNVDGAQWFCSQVWPRVRAQVPGAQFRLVGRNPIESVLQLGQLEGVTVHADVPSMRPYYDQARVVVVPLRAGTGTRLKALEAMAAGRPVVGTPIGLEGLGVTHGQQALIAETPSDFADNVIGVLREPRLAEELARSGRLHAEQRFSWDQIGRDYVDMVSELLDSRHGSAQVEVK